MSPLMPVANSPTVPARTNPDVTVLPPGTVRNPEASLDVGDLSEDCMESTLYEKVS